MDERVASALISRLELLSRSAEPMPLSALLGLIQQAAYRHERILGERPRTWGSILGGAVFAEVPEVSPHAAVEHLISSTEWNLFRRFLGFYARWEALGSPEPNPFEPLVQVCRHGGTLRIASDGCLDVEDFTGKRAGVPVASAFDRSFNDPV